MFASRLAAPLLVSAVLGSSLPLAPAQSVIPEIPQEESPFFVLNEESENPGRRAEKDLTAPANVYPLNRTSDQSAGKMFTSFFTDMFSSVRLVQGKPDSRIAVEPTTFSLDDRREITVTYTVFNRGGRLLKLDFPTSQRIEILVRDSGGRVLERWSDDRAFQDVSGVVMINPGERIQYEEKIATREMQPGQTYTVEASLANNPEFTRTTNVTPSGRPRANETGPQPLPGATASPSPTPTPGA